VKKLFLLFIALALVACNTVSGAGKDLEKASQWTKDKMTK
jgi:predicted small secreted protein